jgi:hypothetical protein
MFDGYEFITSIDNLGRGLARLVTVTRRRKPDDPIDDSAGTVNIRRSAIFYTRTNPL